MADHAAQAAPVWRRWLERHSLAVFVALLGLASLRIVGTYPVFSHTFDEPAHIACGMQWLAQGVYRYEPLHPPLARVAAALGPWLDGAEFHATRDKWNEGLLILYRGRHYQRTLALARLGVLPFFWLAALVVHRWARKYFGEPCAALAVLIFTSLPPVLAHAGLATTDMAVTATIGATFLCALRWCERPGVRNGLWLGASSGLALLSKFSALAFLPAAFAAAFGAALVYDRGAVHRLPGRLRQHWQSLALAALTAFYLVWAGYRFSIGEVWFTVLRLPFPEFYAGIQALLEHQRQGGEYAYLFGRHRDGGWWYYYLVVLAVKTPLALFGLLAWGLVLAGRRTAARGLWLACAFSGGILLFALVNRINLGVRHVLVLYLGFSVIAAAGAADLLARAQGFRPAGWIAAALLLCLSGASALAHPDYLAYFNVLAGRAPERILVDSDLDWGQDLNRLVRRLRELQVRQLAFSTFFPMNGPLQGLPPLQPFDLAHPLPGWNAASITELKLLIAKKNALAPDEHFWVESVPPVEHVGSSYWLWYFPPHGTAPR